jgi:branched-chain amino acid transport system substrate-binding protein
MMMRRVVLLAAAVAALFASAASAQQLTVYSSLATRFTATGEARDVRRGIELALQHADHHAGGRPVRHVPLESTDAREGDWTRKRVAANARAAAQDPTTVGYIGEFDSAATAVAMPILNRAGILHISPTSTAAGLTVASPLAARGEPGKLRPSGARTFGRIVPNDVVQAAAAATLLEKLGVRRLALAHDRQIYGRGMAIETARAARRRGIRVVGMRGVSRRGRPALGRLARRADGFFFGGVAGPQVGDAAEVVDAWRVVSAANARLVKVGAEGLGSFSFTESSWDGIDGRAARRTYVMRQMLPEAAFPPSAQELIRREGIPRPYSLHGYEAAALMLDAIARGGGTREGTVRAFFATRDRESVLGRYSIDANGDTTLRRYGVWKMGRNGLSFDHVIDAAG